MKPYSELEKAILDFMDRIELVFDADWEFTQCRITDSWFISKSGTFLNPKCNDESHHWANRGSLLESYRRLKAEMLKAGVWQPETFPDIFGENN